MTWKDRVKNIQVGDRVAYSAEFCRNTGQMTGPTPFARGTVTKLTPLGETTLATIDWGDPAIPERVNVANLTRITQKGIAE